MERETFAVETPFGKQVVVIKSWITGREFDSLNDPILKKYKIGGIDGTVKETESLDGSVVKEMQYQALRVWIVSINGKTDNIVDSVLDMRKEDYQFVVEKINETSKKK